MRPRAQLWGRLLASAATRAERLIDDYRQSELLDRFGSIGPGTTLAPGVHVSGPANVYLGQNVHIGRGCWIRGDGRLTVGDNTKMSRFVTVYTANHRWEGGRLPYDDGWVAKPVTIGANVWIGMYVCITPGSTIGEGAIIGMGTTVAGTVEPLAIVVSQPMRVVGSRDRSRYDQLKSEGRFGGHNGEALQSEVTGGGGEQ